MGFFFLRQGWFCQLASLKEQFLFPRIAEIWEERWLRMHIWCFWALGMNSIDSSGGRITQGVYPLNNTIRAESNASTGRMWKIWHTKKVPGRLVREYRNEKISIWDIGCPSISDRALGAIQQRDKARLFSVYCLPYAFMVGFLALKTMCWSRTSGNFRQLACHIL